MAEIWDLKITNTELRHKQVHHVMH